VQRKHYVRKNFFEAINLKLSILETQMKFLTKTVIAAALSSIAFAASAMTPIADTELSQVSGQDGVSIAANLNVNIGSFTYTNTNATSGGSVSFNNIAITGVIGATLDVINSAAFNVLAGPLVGEFAPAFYNGTSDVVAIAVPKLNNGGTTGTGLGQMNSQGQSNDATMNIKVASITMGGNTGTAPSFGAMAINGLNLQGTTAFIWAH
jgi:hypothetical protein